MNVQTVSYELEVAFSSNCVRETHIYMPQYSDLRKMLKVLA